jgi:hypothetical protein
MDNRFGPSLPVNFNNWADAPPQDGQILLLFPRAVNLMFPKSSLLLIRRGWPNRAPFLYFLLLFQKRSSDVRFCDCGKTRKLETRGIMMVMSTLMMMLLLLIIIIVKVMKVVMLTVLMQVARKVMIM